MVNLPFGHPAWIEIDLQQFKQNIRLLRQSIGRRLFCLPIKANAYGHGLITIAAAAVEAKVDYLAVSCLQEGALLRQAGIQIPIFVMGAIFEEQIAELIAYELEFSISSLLKAKLTAEKCIQLQKKCKVHVEIDTGMQRTGVRPETAVGLLNYLYETPCFEVVGLYSHFATADNRDDPFAKEQLRIFQEFITLHIKQKGREVICHLANSGGTCYLPASHLDMVRPGILMFGYFPCKADPILAGIKPFFSVKAKIAYFKVVKANTGIGYGYYYKTRQDTRIVTIPVGYGDGFCRALSNRGSVLIRGQRYPIAGIICMDQFMVDIGQSEAFVNEEVVLIGKQGDSEITLLEVAALCETIPYEILCGFNDRLPRFYI